MSRETVVISFVDQIDHVHWVGEHHLVLPVLSRRRVKNLAILLNHDPESCDLHSLVSHLTAGNVASQDINPTNVRRGKARTKPQNIRQALRNIEIRETGRLGRKKYDARAANF